MWAFPEEEHIHFSTGAKDEYPIGRVHATFRDCTDIWRSSLRSLASIFILVVPRVMTPCSCCIRWRDTCLSSSHSPPARHTIRVLTLRLIPHDSTPCLPFRFPAGRRSFSIGTNSKPILNACAQLVSWKA